MSCQKIAPKHPKIHFLPVQGGARLCTRQGLDWSHELCCPWAPLRRASPSPGWGQCRAPCAGLTPVSPGREGEQHKEKEKSDLFWAKAPEALLEQSRLTASCYTTYKLTTDLLSKQWCNLNPVTHENKDLQETQATAWIPPQMMKRH